MASPRHSHDACLWLPRAGRPLPQKKLLDSPGPFRRSVVRSNGCSPAGPASVPCASLEFEAMSGLTYHKLNVVVLDAPGAVPLLGEKAVQLVVPPAAFEPLVVAQPTLDTQPEPLEDAGRPPVLGDDPGPDPVDAKLAKAQRDHLPRRFRGVAL